MLAKCFTKVTVNSDTYRHKRERESVVMEESDAKRIIASQSLSSFNLGDFLVVTNSDFDLTISGEPYVALMLMYHLKSGKYMARIWNQTVSVGWALKGNELEEACQELFGQGTPCMGYPLKQSLVEHYSVSHAPIPRIISKQCRKFLGKYNKSCTSCQECEKIGALEENEGKRMSIYIHVSQFKTDKKAGAKKDKLLVDCSLTSTNPSPEEFGAEREEENEQNQDNYLSNDHSHVNDDSLISLEGNNNEKGMNTCEQTKETVNEEVDGLKKYTEEANVVIDVKTSDLMGFFNSEYVAIETARVCVKNTGKKFKCEHCPFATRARNVFKTHYENLHNQIINDICRKCGYVASCEEGLKQHMVSVHKMGEQKFICKRCPYKTDHKSHMRDHIQAKHNNGEKQFKCDLCPYVSATKNNLTSHIDGVHKNIRKHLCEECGYAALGKGGLRIHKQFIHGIGVKKFMCDRCPYTTVMKGNLKIHVNAVHENLRNHACDICGFTAKYGTGLKRHIKSVHDNIKDQVCGQCGKAFSQRAALNRHLVNVHKVDKKDIFRRKGRAPKFSESNVGVD